MPDEKTPFLNPAPPLGTSSNIEDLIKTTGKTKEVIGKSVDFTTSVRERIVTMAAASLRKKGLPEREIVPPSEAQLMSMVDSVIHSVAEIEGKKPSETVEPDILSVKVGVDLGNQTTVTFQYSPNPDDDRVFADYYQLTEDGQIPGMPKLIDGKRYEGRRSFPEIKTVLEKVYHGDLAEAIQDLPNIREGRRRYVFQNLNDNLYLADSGEETEKIENTIKFLFQGAKQKVFSAEELANIFSWPVDNKLRNSHTPRYAVCTKLPEYPEIVSMLKTLIVPQDEDGSNIKTRAVTALPWIMDKTTLNDEEFQQIAAVLKKWAAKANDPSYKGQGKNLSDSLLVKTNQLAGTFPYLALTENQKQLALRTLGELKKGRFGAEVAEQGIIYLTSQRLLDSV